MKNVSWFSETTVSVLVLSHPGNGFYDDIWLNGDDVTSQCCRLYETLRDKSRQPEIDRTLFDSWQLIPSRPVSLDHGQSQIIKSQAKVEFTVILQVNYVS